jgi:hypothetical protein
MSEHTVAIVSFEGALKREIKRLRERLKHSDLPEFDFTIQAKGRVHGGDVKLEFSLDGDYNCRAVKGSSLGPVVDEFLRRYGWDKLNAPKALSYQKIPSDDTNPEEEIPL